LDASGTWVKLHAENETFLDLTTASDGEVYVIGAVSDASEFIPNRSGVLYMLWSWNDEDGLMPLAYDAGVDQFVIQYDEASDSLYFMHWEGIARFILGSK
jgi:hypothetical protein